MSPPDIMGTPTSRNECRIAKEAILFIIGVAAIICAKLTDGRDWSKAFYLIGTLCFFMLICILVWRCCCCCCHQEKPGYIISECAPAVPTRAEVQIDYPPPYPGAPPAMPPATEASPYPPYSAQAMPISPSYPYGENRQPAFNPNLPPSTLH
ncbi:hypothetical protein BIW11_06347 [Tropilaelaps mercedesae]|uniref:Uncharacterized protein n=1 Tax=Tropilaelaps mercedesae TaxID=418985 RepID=A0A1V9XYI4_9ACAR|nr:hypothetical protein BIW11_06347 [Tropilaelaps mercedesae]